MYMMSQLLLYANASTIKFDKQSYKTTGLIFSEILSSKNKSSIPASNLHVEQVDDKPPLGFGVGVLCVLGAMFISQLKCKFRNHVKLRFSQFKMM